jgi:[acyl-carrier-protein] S-malonyltransferase
VVYRYGSIGIPDDPLALLSLMRSMQVVKVRCESMAAAAKQGKPHGMLSVIGVTDDILEAITAQVRQQLGPDTVCQLANFLFPQVG